MTAQDEPTPLSLHGRPATFDTGLMEIAPSTFAWLQPNGDWSESNAGLIVGDGAAALIDTAWDLRLTRRILSAIEACTSQPLTRLIATHGDGDHVNGFQLIPDAALVASVATGIDIAAEHPGGLRRSQFGARLLSRFAVGAPRRFGTYVTAMMEPFDFAGITLRRPDQTFEDATTLDIGGRTAELTRLGPAHTAGDTIVHLPDYDTVFAGDLLFNGVTPNSWSGTISHWRRALSHIADLEPKLIVPGHGPVGTLATLEAFDDYWRWLVPVAIRHLDAGASVFETAKRIVLSDEFAARPWSAWECPERTVLNVETIKRGQAALPRPITHRERPRLMWQVARLHGVLEATTASRLRPGPPPRAD